MKSNISKDKKTIEAMFNNIAHRYDFLNHLLSGGFDILWRRKVVKVLKKYKPKTILDIATGSGDMAIHAIKANPDKITGVDISEEMIAVAIKKIKKRKLENKIEIIKADAENLEFGDNTFDAVTVCFGVRNFENLEKGLKEIHRALKPNGFVVILEFSKPKIPVIKELYEFYFKKIVPFIGKKLSNDINAYEYLYDSATAFPKEKEFVEILEKLEFADCRYKRITFGVAILYMAFKKK
ncbi:MAG: bifunctional demethylmenaquinone methyltransferase/2-methoxy-6-polyprenyl-1,4-benzoquinol methylase UbiE [Bacteroidales bacterium]|nr:bifunctional demethylmenaquinone methyltransferase/2-methoxy-6-polyprenyl-1,4-benzoquinol methylase UbiE [Bacteroidales bacterium]